MHPLDKYKKENDGSYRCFELHRHRISYRVKDQETIMARVRHTSQQPQQY
ncbi:MAG: type II toxin-antitoxin system RelE/ParE family toxin [Williamsia sp.]|nr:type II toxin-antitoxin system RelE/ParE family toxin [Williamsia sp.]